MRRPQPSISMPDRGSSGDACVAPTLSHLRALTRSSIVSLVATGAEFAILPLLIHVLHIWPAVAYAAVQIIGTTITFFLNKYWAFDAGHVGSLGGQSWRSALVFGGSLALNTGLPSLGYYALHLSPMVSFTIAQALVYLGWNYPMNRYFVFSRGEKN